MEMEGADAAKTRRRRWRRQMQSPLCASEFRCLLAPASTRDSVQSACFAVSLFNLAAA